MNTLTLTRRSLLIGAAALAACSPEKPSFAGIDITGADYAQGFDLPDHNGQRRTLAALVTMLAAIVMVVLPAALVATYPLSGPLTEVILAKDYIHVDLANNGQRSVQIASGAVTEYIQATNAMTA